MQQATTISILFAIAGLAMCISILTASLQRHRQPPPWPPPHTRDDRDEGRPAGGGDRNHNLHGHGADQ